MIGTNVPMYSLSGGLSAGTVLLPPFSGHVKVDMAVKYIPVIKNGCFYCSFGISLASTTIFVCNHTKITNIDREIKYLDFGSGHLASAETQ
jgi:hypothetical protein